MVRGGRAPAGVGALAWLALTAAVVGLAPDLTALVASRPTRLLPPDTESQRALAAANAAWPDQAAASVAVVVLSRPGGLSADDRAHARRPAAVGGGLCPFPSASPHSRPVFNVAMDTHA